MVTNTRKATRNRGFGLESKSGRGVNPTVTRLRGANFTWGTRRRKRVRVPRRSADSLSSTQGWGIMNPPNLRVQAYVSFPVYTCAIVLTHTHSFGSHTMMACRYTSDVISVLGLTAIIL